MAKKNKPVEPVGTPVKAGVKTKKMYCSECDRQVEESSYDFLSGMCRKCVADEPGMDVDDTDDEED